MLDDFPSDHFIARYFAGDLSSTERARLEEWLQADATRRAQMDKLRELWSRAGDQPSDERTVEVWRSVATKLGLAAPTGLEADRVLSLVKHRRPSPIRGIPAFSPRQKAPWIAVGLVAAAVAVFVVRGAMSSPDGSRSPEQVREYATKLAQRADIRLSDGSRVVLAPASRLLVPESYGTKTRAIQLEGEAYFDVVHNNTKPFTVRTRTTVARDIGTAFVVKDYTADKKADITTYITADITADIAASVLVAEGEVAVLSARDSTASTLQLLKRGDLAHVDASGAITLSRVTNIERRLAWLRGGLAFDDVQLADAVKEIGRWYDLDIRLADSSLARRRLIATIGNEPADDVLRLVALTLNLRVERDGRVVTFHPK